MSDDIHPQAFDDATRAAVAALAHRIRERDAAPAEERPDADLFAGEFLIAMRGQGWRPTAARSPIAWQPPHSPPPAPEVAERGAEIARQVLAGGEAP